MAVDVSRTLLRTDMVIITKHMHCSFGIGMCSIPAFWEICRGILLLTNQVAAEGVGGRRCIKDNIDAIMCRDSQYLNYTSI